MEITAGWILAAVSAAGIIGCGLGLLLARKVFARQRKALLDQIETE